SLPRPVFNGLCGGGGPRGATPPRRRLELRAPGAARGDAFTADRGPTGRRAGPGRVLTNLTGGDPGGGGPRVCVDTFGACGGGDGGRGCPGVAETLRAGNLRGMDGNVGGGVVCGPDTVGRVAGDDRARRAVGV